MGCLQCATKTPSRRETYKHDLRVSVPLWLMGARHASPLREQIELLEGPIHDGLGVQTHPLLQDGGIQAPEVVVELEVPIRLLRRCQGWVLTVQPSLDLVAHHQGYSAGTVVRARPVVFHPTTKLGEQQHGDVVPQVVLVQVSEEILDVIGHLSPQLGLQGQSAPVQVEAVVGSGGVKYPGPYISYDRLGFF